MPRAPKKWVADAVREARGDNEMAFVKHEDTDDPDESRMYADLVHKVKAKVFSKHEKRK